MTFLNSSPFGRAALLLSAAALLSACGEQPAADSGHASQRPAEVGVYTLAAQPLTLSTRLPGRTAAYRVAEIRPQVNGIIRERLFTEGAHVKEGEQLYQIDDAIYKAEYEKARANLVSAERLAKRYTSLQKSSAISKQQYDEATAAWRQAQADVELARINLKYTKVLSPITGRIGRSAVTEGALVTSGQAQQMATVQQLDPIYVDLTQPVSAVLRLKADMAAGKLQSAEGGQAKVRLKLEDGSVYPLEGRLKLTEVTVDQTTGSVTLRAEFPNPSGLLMPGMFVQAELDQGVRNDALLVPQQAVQRDSGGSASVWVVGGDGKAVRRPVVTDRTIGNHWLVSEGLQTGEQVVVEGVQRVREGGVLAASPAGNLNPVLDFGTAAAETTPRRG